MEKIYHYTSMDSFYSIINNQTLRFTHSDFLNDPQDCKMFFDIIKNHISQIIENGELEEIIKGSILEKNLNITRIKEVFDDYPITDYLKYMNQQIDMYVLSLTKSEDSLPMWNYYSSGGMQFCFDTEKLVTELNSMYCKSKNQYLICSNINYLTENYKVADLEWPFFENLDVRNNNDKYYPEIFNNNNDKTLHYLIRSFIKSYLYTIHFLIKNESSDKCVLEATEFYKKVFNNNKNSTGDKKFKADIDLYMLILGAFYKPDTYENEDEVRLIYVNYDIEAQDNIHYAVNNGVFGNYIRPYIEFKFTTPESFGEVIKYVRFSPLVKNMPIDSCAVHKAVQGFMKSSLKCDLEVLDSKHKIRW